VKKLIKYSNAQKLSNFRVPIYCPNCNKMWHPELYCRIMNEGMFGAVRMVELHNKECEWCGYKYQYYA